MKKIKFKNLSIQNFLSVGEEKLNLNFQQGINLITGINNDKDSKNGCGKTTILDALYWSIFGNTIRDIKKDKIVHNHSDSKCKVDLFFSISDNDKNEIEYKIERSLNPSKVSLFKKEEDTTYSTIQKTDEAIRELIGANEELFRNSIVMSLDNTLPFMAQKKVEKRKFIESILQINVFSEMLSKVRQDYNDSKKEYDIFTNQFTDKQRTISFLKEQQQKEIENKQNKINLIQEKIKETENKLKENKSTELLNQKTKLESSLTKTDEAIQKIEKKITEISDSLLEKTKVETRIQNEIETFEKIIKSFKNKTGNCPTCKRKLSDENDESIKTHIEELQIQIKQKEEEFNNAISEKNKIVTERTNTSKKKTELTLLCNDLKTKINKLQISIQENNNLSQKIEELNISITEIQNEKSSYIEKIEEFEKEIKTLEEKLTNQQKQLNILENSKLIVSEEGVKTHIIKKLLVFFNNKLNFYLKKLEAPCTCTFDEYFDETITNENKKECSYFNFSGGERKRIDLAILFTFQDILKSQSGIYYSLNMYDELFDSALDEAGANKVLEILREKTEKYNESVYIISHNSAVSKNNIDNTIQLQKNQGKTTIVI